MVRQDGYRTLPGEDDMHDYWPRLGLETQMRVEAGHENIGGFT